MAIGTIAGIIIIILLVAAAGIAYAGFKKGNKGMGAFGAVMAVVMVLALLLVPGSFHTVDTGEVAVVKFLGEARDVRTAGTHFDFWVTREYQIYDAKVQNVDIRTAAYSSDAQTMDIEMTLQYHIMGDKVIDIARQYGSLELLQNRIQSIAIEKTKAILSAHKAMDIIADRASMSPKVEQAIKDAIGGEYYVDVTTVVLTNIDFSDAFESAVEDKMIAEQNQLKAEYENKTKVARANAEGEALKIAAEAEAQAKVIAAQAEAEANKLLEESLTDKILQEMYLEKWNGILPSTIAGEATTLMIPSFNSASGGTAAE